MHFPNLGCVSPRSSWVRDGQSELRIRSRCCRLLHLHLPPLLRLFLLFLLLNFFSLLSSPPLPMVKSVIKPNSGGSRTTVHQCICIRDVKIRDPDLYKHLSWPGGTLVGTENWAYLYFIITCHGSEPEVDWHTWDDVSDQRVFTDASGMFNDSLKVWGERQREGRRQDEEGQGDGKREM